MKKKLDGMQNEELVTDRIDHYKFNKIMGIDLEILWARYGRFQLLILSILMSSISWVFKIFILNFFSSEYAEANNCTLIFPLAHNIVKPEETKFMIKIMASISELINYFLQDFFPVFFLLLTLDEGMNKR